MKRAIACLLIGVLCSVFYASIPSAAHAQASAIVVPSGGYSCSSNGDLQGNFESSQSYAGGNFLLDVVTMFQNTLVKLMGKLYCKVTTYMTPIIGALAVLVIIIFALSFLAGVTRFSTGEALKVVFKIALVFMLATSVGAAMSLTSQLFLGALQDGTTIAFGGGAPDAMAKSMGGAAESGLANLDTPSEPVPNACTSIGLLVVAGFIFLQYLLVPILFFMFTFGMLFMRIISTYLVAITVLCILMGMAPFFIAFSLFRTTKQVFDSWLNNMTSYAIQGIVVMAFLFFIQHIDFLGPLERVGESFRNRTEFIWIGIVFFSVNTCSVCEGFDFDLGSEAVFCGNHVPAADYDGSGVGILNLGMLFQFKFFAYLVRYLVSMGILMWLLARIAEYIPAVAQRLSANGLALAFAADPGGKSKSINPGQAVSLPGIDIRRIQAATGQVQVRGNRLDNMATGFRWAADPFYKRHEKANLRQFQPEYADRKWWQNALASIAPTRRGLIPGLRLMDGVRNAWQFRELDVNAERAMPGVATLDHVRNQRIRNAARKMVETKGHFDMIEHYYNVQSQLSGYGKTTVEDMNKALYEYNNAEQEQIRRDLEQMQAQGKEHVERLSNTAQKSLWDEEEEKKHSFWSSMMGY